MFNLLGAPQAKRRAIALALLLAAVLGRAGTEAAAAYPPSAVPPTQRRTAVAHERSTGPAVVVQAALAGTPRTIILGAGATKRLLGVSATGVTIIAVSVCRLLVPADVKEQCGDIVAVVIAMAGFGNGGGKCLEITVGLLKPPVVARLIPCPVKPTPELVPDPGFSFDPLAPNPLAPDPLAPLLVAADTNDLGSSPVTTRQKVAASVFT